MPNIIDIEGIGQTYAKKLSGIGRNTTEDLLKEGATAKGHKDMNTKKRFIESTMIPRKDKNERSKKLLCL